MEIQIQHLLKLNSSKMLRNKIYISIQIQHLLKLNKFSATATNEPKLIQIQHLLKLNASTRQVACVCLKFKYNTC